MGNFVDIVDNILSCAERRVEISAQNVSNMTTPGYKRAVSFDAYLEPQKSLLTSNEASKSPGFGQGPNFAIDLSPGQQVNTNSPGDLVILGEGFFSVKAKNGALGYTRQGQFHRDAGGRLVSAQGWVLQQQGGGDLVLKAGDFKVMGDGAVIQAGEAIGRVSVVKLSDPASVQYVEDGLYDAPVATARPIAIPSVSQGALEASNVSIASEMTAMMAALRDAQAGQHLMGVYDDLLGRAISTFGQG